MQFFITCTPGVESVLKREIEKIGGTDLVVSDRGIKCSGPDNLIAELNVWIRTGNRVYVVLAEQKTKTFDELFNTTIALDWKKLIPKDAPIIVDAVSVKSELESIPAVQKTIKKAIVTSITGDRESILREDDKVPGNHSHRSCHDREKHRAGYRSTLRGREFPLVWRGEFPARERAGENENHDRQNLRHQRKRHRQRSGEDSPKQCQACGRFRYRNVWTQRFQILCLRIFIRSNSLQSSVRDPSSGLRPRPFVQGHFHRIHEEHFPLRRYHHFLRLREIHPTQLLEKPQALQRKRALLFLFQKVRGKNLNLQNIGLM